MLLKENYGLNKIDDGIQDSLLRSFNNNIKVYYLKCNNDMGQLFQNNCMSFHDNLFDHIPVV